MYHNTYDMCNSPGLKHRMIACAASEGIGNPLTWVEQQMWAMVPLMLAPDGAKWWNVWASAELSKTINHNADSGARTDVILDSWIQTCIGTHKMNLDALGPPVLQF